MTPATGAALAGIGKAGDGGPDLDQTEKLYSREPGLGRPATRPASGPLVRGRLPRASLDLLRWRLPILIVGPTADRAAELANPLAERAPQFRQALWPEHEQGDNQDYADLKGSDVPYHRFMVTVVSGSSR